MTERVRLGVIGLGAMGAELLAAAIDHPYAVVAAAADPSPDAVARASAQFPEIAVSQNAQDIVDSRDLDAVYIATPPIFHAGYATAAMRAGKAVFCEKPLAISTQDGESMLDVQTDTGLTGAVNFALSDRAAVLEIERAISAGEVGEIQGVDIRLSFPVWPREFQADAGWLAGREQGGFIREVFSHFAYLTDRLVGPMMAGFTRLTYADDDETRSRSEISAFGLLTAYPQGGPTTEVPVRVIGQAEAAVEETYEWTLVGTRRSYRLTDWGTLSACEPEGPWTRVDTRGERGTEATRLTAFVKAMRGESLTNLADFATAYRVQQVVEAFHHG